MKARKTPYSRPPAQLNAQPPIALHALENPLILQRVLGYMRASPCPCQFITSPIITLLGLCSTVNETLSNDRTLRKMVEDPFENYEKLMRTWTGDEEVPQGLPVAKMSCCDFRGAAKSKDDEKLLYLGMFVREMSPRTSAMVLAMIKRRAMKAVAKGDATECRRLLKNIPDLVKWLDAPPYKSYRLCEKYREDEISTERFNQHIRDGEILLDYLPLDHVPLDIPPPLPRVFSYLLRRDWDEHPMLPPRDAKDGVRILIELQQWSGLVLPEDLLYGHKFAPWGPHMYRQSLWDDDSIPVELTEALKDGSLVCDHSLQ